MKTQHFLQTQGKSLLKVLLIITIITISIKTEPLQFKRLLKVLQQTNKSPFVNLLFIYDSATQTGKQLEQYVPLVTQPKKDYYKAHLLDCNTQDEQVMKNFPFCSEEMKKSLPALMYTEPSMNPFNKATGEVNQAKQHQYQGKLDEKSLFDFAVPLIKAFSLNLKKVKDWNFFTDKNKQVPTLTYFTDKQKLPTIYKILTAHFRNTIAFAHVMKDSPLAVHFNITKYPTMLLNGKEQIKLTKNLQEMTEKLAEIQGQQSNIIIEQIESSGEELTSQNLQKLVFELPRHILVHVGNQKGQMHPQWKKCQESFKKMFTYYETQALAKELGVKQTPAIVYFPKSLAKKNVQKTIFYPQHSFRNIYDEISSLIEDFTVPLANDMQMQKLTSIPLLEGKFIAVLFHQDQISLSYRVLSNDDDYKKDLVFFRMKDPQPGVMQKFHIEKLPALYIMFNDPQSKEQEHKQKQDIPEGKVQMNLQLAQYKGKFNYDDLSKYLSMFAKKPTSTQQKKEETVSNVELIEINSQKLFQKHCKDSNCYVLLVDGRQSKKEVNENARNQIKKFASKVHQNFVQIDAVCHSELIGQLQIQQEELPTFIYLNSKFEKFSRVIGRIEEKSLNLFISKIKGNKAAYRPYDKLTFDAKKNCLEEHKKLDQYQSGASSEPALDQAELQILRQIQEQEQKKKQQLQKMEKELEKNDRKKRRRRRPKDQQDSDL